MFLLRVGFLKEINDFINKSLLRVGFLKEINDFNKWEFSCLGVRLKLYMLLHKQGSALRVAHKGRNIPIYPTPPIPHPTPTIMWYDGYYL